MAITWQNVLNIAAELSAVPLASQTQILAEAAANLSPTKWGALYDTGCTYLAAHLGTIFLRGTAGQVQTETLGPMSRTYATGQQGDVYDSTPYGKTFKVYRRKVVPRIGGTS